LTDRNILELWSECKRLAKETAYSDYFNTYVEQIYKHVDSRIMKYWRKKGGKRGFIPKNNRNELKTKVLNNIGIDEYEWKERGWDD